MPNLTKALDEGMDNFIKASTVVKDSGKHREFKTGAKRDSKTGKGRFDLLQLFTLKDLAGLLEAGAVKYDDRNWETGIPISEYIDSGTRHLVKFQQGLTDENHLIMACWNFMCAYDTIVRIDLGLLERNLDDLPYPLRNVSLHRMISVLGENWVGEKDPSVTCQD